MYFPTCCGTSTTQYRRVEPQDENVSKKRAAQPQTPIIHRKTIHAASKNHLLNDEILTSNYDCTIGLLLNDDLDEIIANNNRYAFTLLLSAMSNSDNITFETVLSKRPDLLTIEDDKGNLLLNIADRPDLTIFLQIIINQLIPELNREQILRNGTPLIRYPLSTSDEKKNHYEALLSKCILENPKNIYLIRKISKILAMKVKATSNDEWQTYVDYHQAAQEQLNFPTSKLFDITSKETFSTQLLKVSSSQENHIIDLLSAIYRIPSILLEKKNPFDTDRIYQIYSNFNYIGRNHTVHEQWRKPESISSTHQFQLLDEIGYSKIPSQLMKNLNPLKKRSAYYRERPYTNDQQYSLAQKNSQLKIPYVAGTSGISNCFYAAYLLLKIPFESEEGQRLVHIVSAAQVATGSQTFQEGFAITHAYFNCAGKVYKDFKNGKGAFTPLPPSYASK
ncbi:hypothetical protein [uncultured Endozoicomonas sp.]|uniref:hypothetical protein n=1 Tax=uncultured Endozoicomonas sp. TaxID=432652 RepID=UPI002638C84E|nr:hypothetical protein [uncultured Endozoicomonas sp.]